MSHPPVPEARHRNWCRLYRAFSVLMPSAMREKHGAAMVELFAQELDRSRGSGIVAFSRTAVAGIGDLLQRGLYERVIEERVALTAPNVQLLRGLVKSFFASFVVLTALLLATYTRRRVLEWSAPALPFGTVFEEVLLAVPFTAALTLPMAMFVAVLATAHRAREREDTVRLRLAPLVGLASLVALFAFAWNAEVVPRANARLSSLQAGAPVGVRNDRSMTLSELRSEQRMASRRAVNQGGAAASAAQLATVANYGVEIHKKPAIAAACVVLALLALAIARRAPRTGVVVQVLASGLVFTAYYAIISAGETLAEQSVIPPVLAMWSANILLLGIAVLALRRQRARAGVPYISAPRSP